MHDVLRSETWLRHLALTTEHAVNLERVQSMEELKGNPVLDYVERTLRLLAAASLWAPEDPKRLILEDVLKWSEVAKCGMPHQRKLWEAQGVNLAVHNVGSAQIFRSSLYSPDQSSLQSEPAPAASPSQGCISEPQSVSELHSISELQSTMDHRTRLVHDLILTHGLIGQHLRGEVPFSRLEPLSTLVSEHIVSAGELRAMLEVLHDCIVGAVDERLRIATANEARAVIGRIVGGECQKDNLTQRSSESQRELPKTCPIPFTLRDRCKRLRSRSIEFGENFDAEFERILAHSSWCDGLSEYLDSIDLWYVEAALYDFSFEEFTKILMLCRQASDRSIRHLSFERLMRDLHYEFEGRKRVNLYKKRIIEKYLGALSLEDIVSGCMPENPHVSVVLEKTPCEMEKTAFFVFRFSPAGARLIDFCVEAEKSDVLYEQAILLLFDLFGLRRDAYDRFNNEESYLQTMNRSIDEKKVILDFIAGTRVIDIGPGGGALMDLIEAQRPDVEVTGLDISQNVLDALRKKKQIENRRWNVAFGDALDLGQSIAPGSVDTIIFCSILHELFSYIEFEGRKFNHATLAAALRSAFAVLAPGGRIIIRDGIMTEPEDQVRVIRFLSKDGMDFLTRYANDFRGRTIAFEPTGLNEVRMPINDAMEFLYTYTWGEKSYVHEIHEQFGYFTPVGYEAFIRETLGAEAHIVVSRHYLQEGYAVALSPKIALLDGDGHAARLPDSTCLIVIEKTT